MSYRTFLHSAKLAVPRPLDLVAPTAFVACSPVRRLKGSYTGPLIRLRRASDSAELDIGQVGGGVIDQQAVATWAAGTTSTLVTIYDQSGNGSDLTNAVAANQPNYTTSGDGQPVRINGIPLPAFDGSTDFLSDDDPGEAQPTTVLIAFLHSGTLGEVLFDGGSGGSTDQALAVAASSKFTMESGAGIDTSAASAAVFANHIFSTVWSGASSTIRINNNAEETLASVGSADSDGLTLGAYGGGASGNMNLGLYEVMKWQSALTTAEQTLIRNNMNAYYKVW